jgi:hypothetical protein
LSFGSNVCANPGKFGAIFGHMYVQNSGKLLGGEGGMYQNPGEFLAAACSRQHLGMPISPAEVCSKHYVRSQKYQQQASERQGT